MRYFRFLFILIAFAPLTALAQNLDSNALFFDAVAFAGPSAEMTTLDLYLGVPYDLLTFERDAGRFSGKYQAQIRVEGAGRTWYDSTFSRTPSTASYEVTSGRSRAYDVYQQRLPLPPGSYTATVELLDMRSNRTTSSKRAVTTVNYGSYPFALSGLLLVSRIREDSSGFVITPMLTDNVSTLDEGYFLFFEVYNNLAKEDFVIDAIYTSPGGTEASRLRFEKKFPQGRSQQWLRLPNEGVSRGAYTIELKVAALDDTTRTLAASQRTVRFGGSLFGLPISDAELEDKVTQLRYVATQTEIDNIRDATSFQEKKKRYAEFWQKLDPTPGTPENEAMDEYFRRIGFANEQYRSYAAGWLTDKGRVFVIYGPPDNTVTDSFRSDGKAAETWQYYARNLRFTFIDESGFGDFRLTMQLPPGEKYRYGR